MSETTESAAASPVSGRILAVDALRGFDMFWIAGGKPLLFGWTVAAGVSLPAWLSFHLEHVPWEGFSAWDLIMPLFLFISGVSLPFSLGRRLTTGQEYRAVYRRILRRIILLWILGMVAQGHLLEVAGMVIKGHPDIYRLHFYSNTLQAIAAGYGVTAVVLLHARRDWQLFILSMLLVVYWAVLTFVPVPGHPAGLLEPRCNIALWVDERLLGPFRDGTEYTWILSSLGFAASVLLGAQAGHILRSQASWGMKLAALAGCGLVCLGLGWLWGQRFPIIKHLWTSSMVLWAAGWSFLLLAIFFALTDMLGIRRPFLIFTVIGMNAIVAYMGAPFLGDGVDYLIDTFTSASPMQVWLGDVASFCILWLVLWGMYRKRWFVRL